MTQPSKAGQALALVAVLVAVLTPARVAAEPVPGFGFGGVVEVPEAERLFAMDDGGFVLVTFEGLTKIGPDGAPQWTVEVAFTGVAASDGTRTFTLVDGGVIALDEDGERDATFGDDGFVALARAGYLAVGRDGRLVVYPADGGIVTRLARDGSVDDTFEVIGSVAAVADDGAVFTDDGGSPSTVRRYTSGGDLDVGWGDAGRLSVDFETSHFTVAPDGSLVAARVRYGQSGATDYVHLLKWTPSGDPDLAFGLGGVADARTRCGPEVLHGVDVGPDGTIYVVGADADVFDSSPVFVSAFTPTGRLRGYEDLGSGSPYTFVGRDVHLSLTMAVRDTGGRVGVVASGSDGRSRLHAVDIATSFDGPDADTGYWLVHGDGAWPRGSASQCAPIVAERAIVGAASGATRFGYWMVDAAGRVEVAGKVGHHGQVSIPLNAPVLGITARPQGDGYWIVAGDGGIFSFGGAAFHGSTGAMRLNQPILGMAATPSGNGYWLVARDGGIFTFGDATFFGSTGAITLNRPIVGMAPTSTGLGYWMVAADGGVFTFGDARYLGSSYDWLAGPRDGFVGIMTP